MNSMAFVCPGLRLPEDNRRNSGEKSVDAVGETTGGARGILSNLKQFPKRFFGFWQSCCELETMPRQNASHISIADAEVSETNRTRETI
jgi:hypothetical protein